MHMLRRWFPTAFVAFAVLTGLGGDERFDDGWEFKLWNIPVFYIAKGGLDHRKSVFSISSIHDDTNGWRRLSLPHDWMVEQPVSRKWPNRNGHRAFGENGIGYYRKWFPVPAAAEGKRIFMRFDGVYREAQFWVNGCYLGRNESGFIGRRFEITDFLRYGETNNSVIVRVDAARDEGWWYGGAGIYRHVWLEYHDEDGVVPDSMYIRLKELKSDHAVMRADWETFASGRHEKEFVVRNPRLWSPDDPHLYTFRTNGEEFTYGIRTVTFDPDKGLLINGKRVQVKGVCCHQDHAGVGVAVPDAINEYRIRRLKSMGVNAYRSSHNPAAPDLLDICDRQGILVLDEARLFSSGPEGLDQLRRMILRGRNHPCIIAWSFGNEEHNLQNNETGRRIVETMKRVQRELDPSRVCTYGGNNGVNHIGANLAVDVRGVNYVRICNRSNPMALDAYHKAHPKVPIWGTEEASSLTTRGCETNEMEKVLVMRDADLPENARWDWSMTAEDWTTYVESRPWFAGAFAWTGFDYRGESNWPAPSCNFGILDLCGFDKNTASYYRARWTDGDVLHIYPHANLSRTNFWVNTNCDEVELFVNGRSVGRRMREKGVFRLSFPVAFDKGTVVARGRRGGREVVDEQATTGPFAALTLEPDRPTLTADGRDAMVVAVIARDAAGREIPDCCEEVVFALSGPGRILGVGNGDPLSHEDDVCLKGPWKRRFFNGRCQVIVSSGCEPGSLTLRASCEPATAETRIGLVNPDGGKR